MLNYQTLNEQRGHPCIRRQDKERDIKITATIRRQEDVQQGPQPGPGAEASQLESWNALQDLTNDDPHILEKPVPHPSPTKRKEY
jgi:hypothetical protein